jgi:hypothetical protein
MAVYNMAVWPLLLAIRDLLGIILHRVIAVSRRGKILPADRTDPSLTVSLRS